MSNFELNKKNDLHYNICKDKLLNIISTAMAYHFSMNGTFLDEDTNKPIYSNVFKTIDMLMNAWLMIESIDNEKNILDGLDLDIEDNLSKKIIIKKNVNIINYDKQLNKKKININLPDEIPRGINSKDLLIPYTVNCDSERFMSRFIIEKNNDLIFNGKEMNKKFDMNENKIQFNNINITFNPANELSKYTDYSDGFYITMEELYYLEENNINLKKICSNEKKINNNFININKNINNDIEKNKRQKVHKNILSLFGYNYKPDVDIVILKNLHFNQYPSLINYLSLLSSYYGIYYRENNNNYLLSFVDIMKYNLFGSKHFKINQCKFKNNDIKVKMNNIVSNEVHFKKLKKIKDILYTLGNSKNNTQFKLSTHNHLIVTDVKYNNKNATIYEVFEEFGNQSNKDYLLLWNNFNDLFKKLLILNDYDFQDFNNLIKIKKDNINYEYKSNFRDLINIIKPNINSACFSYTMRLIKKFYEDIEIPIFSEDLNDKKYENNFPNKFRGNNNYNKLFNQRIGLKYNFYKELINDKILSNN